MTDRVVIEWAQFPWVEHRWGEHALSVAYTLRNDGSAPGRIAVHVEVYLEGEVVHVEDRASPGALAPGMTWDDRFGVSLAEPEAVYDIHLQVTTPDDPESVADVMIKSRGEY